MALKRTITLSNGLTVQDAYIRIDTINGYKGSLQISVNSYTSQEAFNTGQGYLEQKLCSFIPSVANDSKNFIRQGYDYLKTLDEYKNAVDVLELGQIL